MATSVQTSYAAAPAAGYAGALADVGPHDVASENNSNSTGITAGLVVLRSGDRLVRPILSSDEPTADDDAIVTTHASVASKLVLATTDLNGVIGQLEISPPKNLTITLSSHANFDATVAVVRGLDWAGMPVSETFVIPDAGNAVLTGDVCFSKVLEIEMQAQGGTAGSFTVGTGVKLGPINRTARGIAVYDAMREPGTFAQYERVSVLRKGRIYVSAEAAVTEGDPVFVRFVATGNEVRGAVRAAPDSTDCALLAGARFATTTTAAGIAVVDLNLPAG